MNMKARLVYFFIFVVTILIASDLAIFFLLSQKSSDSIAINVSGRQRMLSQKITKETFFLESHPEYKDKLQKSVTLFDTSLHSLIHGNKDIGIFAPTNPAIIKQLKLISSLWTPFREHANLAIAATTKKEHAQARNFLMNHNEQLLTEMNKAVKMIEEESISRAKISNFNSGLIMIGVLLFALLFAWYSYIYPSINQIENVSFLVGKKITELNRRVFQITNAFQAISDSSNNQASALEEIAQSHDQIRLRLQEISQEFENTVSQSLKTQEIANDSVDQTKVLSEEFQKMNEAIQISFLSNKKIKKIASQTKLLSVNAAIEAAKSQEKGHAFSVIADEVGDLSNKVGRMLVDSDDQMDNTLDAVNHCQNVVSNNLSSLNNLHSVQEALCQRIYNIQESRKIFESTFQQLSASLEEVNTSTQKNSTHVVQSVDQLSEMNTLFFEVETAFTDLKKLI